MSDALIVRLALEWLGAERKARGDTRPISKMDDEYAIAADRVYQVLAGDVRWSDASPGDKHIWRSRFRDVERFDRWWRAGLLASNTPSSVEDPDEDDRYNQTTPKPRRGERKPSAVKQSRVRREYTNLFDTAIFGREPYHRAFTINMFTNANVGTFRLSNMQTAGVLHGDQEFYLDTVYCVPNNMGRFMTICDVVFATLAIGNRQMWRLHLRELFSGIPVRQTIPPAQTFGVQLELAPFAVPDDFKIPAFECSVHLEGVMVWH